MTYRTLLVVALATLPTFSQSLHMEPTQNPSVKGSIQPNWSVTSDGSAVFSWVEPAADGSYSLRYAVRRGAQWSEARTVAAKRHFFRQPAEIPEVMEVKPGAWMAHWVEMPNESSEAEYVYVSSSTDGVKWTAPVMAHHDRSAVEHGLASMIASGTGETSIFWLEALHGEDAPVYLMRTVVDATGKEIREERLDEDVCACCPTAVAKTTKGLVVAYRDHTSEDIRDISIIRFENGKWTQPKNLSPDKWKLNACPTNAAAIGSKGDRVAVSWFTGAQDNPRVQIAFSADGGSTFGKPALVSTGHAFGYTSIAIDDDANATVSWLEQGGQQGARVMARTISANGTAGPAIQVAEGGRMALGYPRVVHSSTGTLIAWGDPKQVQTAQLKK